jgi:hypothetical protein
MNAVYPFHGAGGGAPKGNSNGAYRHGQSTAEAKASRQTISLLLKKSRNLMADI